MVGEVRRRPYQGMVALAMARVAVERARAAAARVDDAAGRCGVVRVERAEEEVPSAEEEMARAEEATAEARTRQTLDMAVEESTPRAVASWARAGQEVETVYAEGRASAVAVGEVPAEASECQTLASEAEEETEAEVVEVTVVDTVVGREERLAGWV